MKVQFWTYSLDDDKPLTVVIRGLPFKNSIEDIKLALIFEGYIDLEFTKMYKGPMSNTDYMSLFNVSLAETPEAGSISALTSLMGALCKFEVYKGRKGPSQYYNC